MGKGGAKAERGYTGPTRGASWKNKGWQVTLYDTSSGLSVQHFAFLKNCLLIYPAYTVFSKTRAHKQISVQAFTT